MQTNTEVLRVGRGAGMTHATIVPDGYCPILAEDISGHAQWLPPNAREGEWHELRVPPPADLEALPGGAEMEHEGVLWSIQREDWGSLGEALIILPVDSLAAQLAAQEAK